MGLNAVYRYSATCDHWYWASFVRVENFHLSPFCAVWQMHWNCCDNCGDVAVRVAVMAVLGQQLAHACNSSSRLHSSTWLATCHKYTTSMYKDWFWRTLGRRLMCFIRSVNKRINICSSLWWPQLCVSLSTVEYCVQTIKQFVGWWSHF